MGWFYGTLHNWKYARLPKSAVVPRMGLAALYDIQQQCALEAVDVWYITTVCTVHYKGSRFMIYNSSVHCSLEAVDLFYTTTMCTVHYRQSIYDIQQRCALFTRGSRFMIYNNNVHSSIGSVDFIIYTTTVCNVRTPTRDSRFSRNKNLQLTADAFWHYKIYLLLAFFSIQSRCKI